MHRLCPGPSLGPLAVLICMRVLPLSRDLSTSNSRVLKCKHFTPVLKTLHWFPILFRAKENIFTMTFKGPTQSDFPPIYLSDLICYSAFNSLHSSHIGLCHSLKTLRDELSLPPTKFVCGNPKFQYLNICLYLKIGSLQS